MKETEGFIELPLSEKLEKHIRDGHMCREILEHYALPLCEQNENYEACVIIRDVLLKTKPTP
jgi:hypothetical protein